MTEYNERFMETDKVSQIKNAQIGDIITFGKYEWIVLDKTSDVLLVITKDIIDYKAYNKARKSVTWDSCTLRSWLNNEFYNEFTEEEKEKILNTNVKNDDNLEYGTAGGEDTTDRVFLLSMAEADKYFKDDDERAVHYDGEELGWWLRSPGRRTNGAVRVHCDGWVSSNGLCVSIAIGVRPALNLKF